MDTNATSVSRTERANFIALATAPAQYTAYKQVLDGNATSTAQQAIINQTAIEAGRNFDKTSQANKNSTTTPVLQPSSSTSTTTPTNTTPVATTTTSADYTQGVTVLNSTQARIWFKPTTPLIYVDVHYTVNGGAKQNILMTNNKGTWQQTVSGLANGSVISYSFTYEKSGLGYDSSTYSYTFNE